MQTWKKLQEVQVALADIFSKIPLLWGHFESKIPHSVVWRKKSWWWKIKDVSFIPFFIIRNDFSPFQNNPLWNCHPFWSLLYKYVLHYIPIIWQLLLDLCNTNNWTIKLISSSRSNISDGFFMIIYTILYNIHHSN